ncbi:MULTISPECIES: hypothetical protein [unclassified Streptomyces]|uniref:hypothetical protein n=1 Tax=unclassified Streptomyces TaxID=2593676 RepID=UPI002E139C69|nr:hypothetical protein OG299_09415 [Streptomyces sp. NBC_01296]WSW62702.1 hypothetical protein OG513_31250 [Streptomyces sp. NBC_00998]
MTPGGPTTPGGPAGRITVEAGRVDVLHRLALAVRPLDARSRAAAGPGLRVGYEDHPAPGRRQRGGDLVRPLEGHGATGFVLRHATAGRLPAAVTVRVDDPARRWIPRRFSVPLWTRAELSGSDEQPPTAPHVRADARLLIPWLLPGPGHPVPQGTTGLRFRVTRPDAASTPVRWPRVDAFGPGGVPLGWAHGDEHGQVLLLIDGVGVLPYPAPSKFPVALRTHAPDPPADPQGDTAADPLAGLVAEPVVRSANPPRPQDLDNEVLRGTSRPAGYRTAAADAVRTLTVGRVVRAADLPHSPA